MAAPGGNGGWRPGVVVKVQAILQEHISERNWAHHGEDGRRAYPAGSRARVRVHDRTDCRRESAASRGEDSRSGQGHFTERSFKRIVDPAVPQVADKIGEVVKDTSTERSSKRTEEQIVNRTEPRLVVLTGSWIVVSWQFACSSHSFVHSWTRIWGI